MKKISVIHGPNLNLLGIREPNIYGNTTLSELNNHIKAHGQTLDIDIYCFQSNYEGGLVGYIQQSLIYQFDGIIINPAALTHTSISILDALKAVDIPFVEVHLSNINEREDFRKKSFIREYAMATIHGKGHQGYLDAIDILANKK